jgi:hypothetical protein
LRELFQNPKLQRVLTTDFTVKGQWLVPPMDKLYPAHRKKQDYQPFAVPFAFAVLKDIDYKLLLKKLDREIAKTFDMAILHLSVGYENKDGKVLINNDNIRYLRELFQNPKLQRVLTTDFTVKGQWLVPPMDKLLGKEKYEEVDNDLKSALFGAFFSDTEKFASVSIKVKVFIEKLKEARRSFIDSFLESEIKRVCKDVGFKNWPKPKFVDLDLQDEITLRKIYARMAEIGFLTPQELQKAIDNGVLPDSEESLENQRAFKKLKDEGLYTPILNQKPQDGGAAENGRPTGTKGVPQSTKNVKPMGTKATYSLKKIIETTKAANNIQFDVIKALKKKMGVKKLAEEHLQAAKTLTESILINEPQKNWQASIESYLTEPKPVKEEVRAKLIEIQNSFDVEESLAILLEVSNKE